MTLIFVLSKYECNKPRPLIGRDRGYFLVLPEDLQVQRLVTFNFQLNLQLFSDSSRNETQTCAEFCQMLPGSAVTFAVDLNGERSLTISRLTTSQFVDLDQRISPNTSSPTWRLQGDTNFVRNSELSQRCESELPLWQAYYELLHELESFAEDSYAGGISLDEELVDEVSTVLTHFYFYWDNESNEWSRSRVTIDALPLANALSLKVRKLDAKLGEMPENHWLRKLHSYITLYFGCNPPEEKIERDAILRLFHEVILKFRPT